MNAPQPSFSSTQLGDYRIAVLVPCYNEALTIGSVIADFRKALPSATIYVYDNNSTDGTAEVASKAGAVVCFEPFQGKGQVVRRMFSNIEADIYVLVDGDATYDAFAAPMLIEALVHKNLDCVNAVRVAAEEEAYRPGHRFGNWMLTTMVSKMFGRQTSDMLTGYRVFSRRYVKSFPALATGFEIETEITVHALELRMLVADIETTYKGRPEGSVSKLSTYKDGIKILKMIIMLIKEERPFLFFGSIAMCLFLAAIALFIPVFFEFMQTGEVRRLPTAVLSTGLTLAAFLSFGCGLILDTVTLGRREMKRITYLQLPGVNPNSSVYPSGRTVSGETHPQSTARAG